MSDDTEKKRGWLSRLKAGLGKSASALGDGISNIFTKRKLDAAALEELEDLLIAADLGPAVAARVSGKLAEDRFDKEISEEEIKDALAGVVTEILEPVAQPLTIDPGRRPHVVLVVGVNGTGKTTTIGKIAHNLAADGKSVVLAAADTFRAAAGEQLEMWADRANADIVRGGDGADPSSVIFDAIASAKAKGSDIVLADTAGRLQNKTNLMEELRKMRRVADKGAEEAGGSVTEVLLVIDATTGQNGLTQAKVFADAVQVTGVVLTKLDGSAKGGIVMAIQSELDIPVKLVGLGEGAEDLIEFDADQFVDALFEA